MTRSNLYPRTEATATKSAAVSAAAAPAATHATAAVAAAPAANTAAAAAADGNAACAAGWYVLCSALHAHGYGHAADGDVDPWAA